MRAETFSGYEGLEPSNFQNRRSQTGKYLCEPPRPASRRWTIQFSPANFTARGGRWSWATRSGVVEEERNDFPSDRA